MGKTRYGDDKTLGRVVADRSEEMRQCYASARFGALKAVVVDDQGMDLVEPRGFVAGSGDVGCA